MIIRSNALVVYWLETQICLSLISPRVKMILTKLKTEISWPITLNFIISVVNFNQMN